MRTSMLRATATFLLVFFPMFTSAQPAQGMLQAQGTVTVNGASVAATTTLFAGDRIQTGAASLATISAQGVMVQLEPDTTAIFAERTLDLGCGSTVVTTSVGTMVRVAGITVTPAAAGTTRIAVSQMNGAIKITAQENWAVVNDGSLRRTLAPRQSATFDRPAATCNVVYHPLAQGSSRIYLPAAVAAVGTGVVAYCATNWFCSQSSPAGP